MIMMIIAVSDDCDEYLNDDDGDDEDYWDGTDDNDEDF
jgi:hypothetical protein